MCLLCAFSISLTVHKLLLHPCESTDRLITCTTIQHTLIFKASSPKFALWTLLENINGIRPLFEGLDIHYSEYFTIVTEQRNTSTMSIMRIAIAGTCGLALEIAREIQEETSHQLLILSRTVSLLLPPISLFRSCSGPSHPKRV